MLWLGAHGAESKKPIKIFAPVDWIANLKKPIDRNRIFETLCTSVDGKHTGKSKALKSSQHYPQPFGQKVADEFLAHVGVPAYKPSKSDADNFIQRHD